MLDDAMALEADTGGPQAGEGDSERALIARCRNGEAAAYEVLIERHRHQVAAVVWRALGQADDVEDVVQEAFVAAYRGLRRFRGEASFLTWVCGIALNLARQRLRSAWKRRVVLGAGPADLTPDQGDVEARIALKSAVAALSPKYRAPLLLHFLHGWTSQEIGESLGIPAATVRTRVHEACRRLRRALRDYPTEEIER